MIDELPRSPAVPWHFVRRPFLTELDIHVIIADLAPLLLCCCILFSLKTRLHFHFSASFCTSHIQSNVSVLVSCSLSSEPYVISPLNSYNLRQNDVAVVDVGVHRAIAVTAGILFAALVSRFWWPAEARRELSKSLSEFSTSRLLTWSQFSLSEN